MVVGCGLPVTMPWTLPTFGRSEACRDFGGFSEERARALPNNHCTRAPHSDHRGERTMRQDERDTTRGGRGEGGSGGVDNMAEETTK